MRKAIALLAVGMLLTACEQGLPKDGDTQAQTGATPDQPVAKVVEAPPPPPPPPPVKKAAKVVKAVKAAAPKRASTEIARLPATGNPALDELGQFLASTTNKQLEHYLALYPNNARFSAQANERLSNPGKPSAAYADKLMHRIVAVMSESLQSIEGKAKHDKQKSLEKIRRSFADFVGFEMIEKFVLGKHYKTATPKQLERFKKAYRLMLLKVWNLDTLYAWSGSVKIAPMRIFKKYPDDVFIPATISSDKENKKVELRLKKRKEGVGVILVDVMVDGVSLLAAQRQDFLSVLSREGIDKLTDNLATLGNKKG